MLAGAVIIGAYRVLNKIGEGGMGTVYLGEHMLLGRKVAIKVLLPSMSVNEEIVQRFFNEVRAVTLMAAPGIVQIFDFGFHTDGSAFIVMESLEGEPMDKRLARIGRFGLAVCGGGDASPQDSYAAAAGGSSTAEPHAQSTAIDAMLSTATHTAPAERNVEAVVTAASDGGGSDAPAVAEAIDAAVPLPRQAKPGSKGPRQPTKQRRRSWGRPLTGVIALTAVGQPSPGFVVWTDVVARCG